MPIMVIWQDWEGQDDYSNIVPSLFSQRSKTRIIFSCTKRLSEGRFRKFHTFELWRKREIPVLRVSEPWPGNGYGWAPGDQMGPWLLSPPPPRPLLHQEEQDKITLFRFSRIARKVMVGAKNTKIPGCIWMLSDPCMYSVMFHCKDKVKKANQIKLDMKH